MVPNVPSIGRGRVGIGENDCQDEKDLARYYDRHMYKMTGTGRAGGCRINHWSNAPEVEHLFTYEQILLMLAIYPHHNHRDVELKLGCGMKVQSPSA